MTTALRSASTDGATRRPSRPVVLLIPVPGTVDHPRFVGRHQTAGCFRCFGAADVLPGLGDDRVGGGPGAGGAQDRAHSARRAAVGTALAVDRSRPGRFFTAALAGGSPVISMGGVEIGLGGALNFLRITALSIVLLGLGAMVSWTTNVAEIGPALATLGRPLRLLRIPVDEWAVAVGARAARLPDVDRRIPGALRRSPAAAQTRSRAVARLGAGGTPWS